MEYYFIEELNKTGLVKAFCTYKNSGRWRIYSKNKESNMEYMKYYEMVAADFDISPSDMIRVEQKHSNNILVATKETAGEGVVRQEAECGYDGIVTNEKNIMLCTLEADCTPVYILDPIKKAIAMVHSGWRGSASKVAFEAIKKMHANYGTNIKDVLIYFGPAICQNCYEVGEELITDFKKILDDEEIEKVFKYFREENGIKKYHLDVTEAIRLSLIKDGVKMENIYKNPYCTYHSDMFDSWRKNKDNTKHMLTAIMLV